MISVCPKRAVLAALRPQPDFSHLADLPALEGAKFLRWLDRSGLALLFLRQLEKHDVSFRLAPALQCALRCRHERNIERTADMLGEAQRLCLAFRERGLAVAALKGFTLTPDFCDDPSLRHQVDFDFLVDPDNIPAAAEVLRDLGYSAAQVNQGSETSFVTPLRHIPSSKDDLYARQTQRQVDLHVSLWDPCPWLPLEAPQNCLQSAVPRRACGLAYLGLSLEDAFLFQVLHAFRHSLRSWVRLSWLFEIGKCLQNRHEDEALWVHVIRRAGPTQLMKSACAFVLGLVHRLFQIPIPGPLHDWSEEARTDSLRAWLEHFAVDWSTADWPGSLNNLFLAKEFIPNGRIRGDYWRSRLLPSKTQTSLGSSPRGFTQGFVAWHAARARYVAERGVVHLKDLLVLPWHGLRWKRALQSSRRLTFRAA
jgi:Uncharacterised nucleotidyltransferase